MTAWPFSPLKPFSYDLAMVDPPWPYELRSEKGEAKSFRRHYGAMTWKEIEALPVGHLLAEHAFAFVWCTWPLLLYGGDPKIHFADADASVSPVGRCLKAWGLRYISGGAWHKRTSTGKTSFGTGYRTRSSCEPFLLAVNGQPENFRGARNLIEGLAREHSRKPEEAFAWCERYMPHARRVELFSRQSRPGWDTWGYQAGKFDPVVHQGAEGAIETAA
jgi:N6-adenosine-specific RNA methylase IME4